MTDAGQSRPDPSQAISLDDQIARWREYVDRRTTMSNGDADELEAHLRDQVGEFTDAGLAEDEAFLVAVKRLGSLDDLSREFAREHSERLWKQLVLTGEDERPGTSESRRTLFGTLLFALLAAALVKIPTLFGLDLDDDAGFYFRNMSLLALIPLGGYFAWRRRISLPVAGTLALLFGLGIAAANMYPVADEAHTSILTGLHLPIAMWLVVGIAYTGGDWRSDTRRMDFIRFTGEWFIYFVLIGLGGGVLTGFTLATFSAIGIDAEIFISEWLLPCGAAGAVVVAAWLVEAKQSVIENMAPVLTRVFTPLFTLAMLAFLGAAALTTTRIGVDREVLILFDLLLVVVLGLLLYSISARERTAPAGIFDWQQLALVGTALIVDALVLAEIIGRISEWGASPNRVAALGENIILLVNLAGSAWLLIAFLRHRRRFTAVERWQTGYLAVFFGWAWIVVLVFPPLFDFA